MEVVRVAYYYYNLPEWHVEVALGVAAEEDEAEEEIVLHLRSGGVFPEPPKPGDILMVVPPRVTAKANI